MEFDKNQHHGGTPDAEYFKMIDQQERAAMAARYGYGIDTAEPNRMVKVSDIVVGQINEIMKTSEKEANRQKWNAQRNI